MDPQDGKYCTCECSGRFPEVWPAPLGQDLQLQPASDPLGGRHQRIQQGPRVPGTQVQYVAKEHVQSFLHKGIASRDLAQLYGWDWMI